MEQFGWPLVLSFFIKVILSGALPLLGYCHCMYNKWLAPTIDYWQPPFSMVRQPTMPNLAAMFDSITSKNSCHEMPINRGIMWEQNERGERTWVCAREWRERELQWQQPCCHCSSCKCSKRAGSWVWVKWSSSSMYVVILSLYISNNMDSLPWM